MTLRDNCVALTSGKANQVANSNAIRHIGDICDRGGNGKK